MTILPVIDRELREFARQGPSYWLRMAGAGSLLLVVCVYSVVSGQDLQGAELFAALHAALFITLWVFTPLMVADCLSRERREGTLPLLFLTPLRAPEIVAAKAIAHGARALTLLTAAIPVITLTFLLGGVSWKEAVLSCLTNLSALCWALGLGLWASSRCTRRVRALVLAVVSGVLGLLVFAALNVVLMALAFMVPGSAPVSESFQWMATIRNLAFPLALNLDQTWTRLVLSAGGVNIHGWIFGALATAACAVLALAFLTQRAAVNARIRWHEEPLTGWKKEVRDLFLRPAYGVSVLHWWLRRKLERNPVGWLVTRTWSGRLLMWSWLAVMIALYSLGLGRAASGYSVGTFRALEVLLGMLLLVSLCFTAAGSFQQERESGVLELLMVTPVGANRILGGRLRGIWGQFLPALLLWLAIRFTVGREFAWLRGQSSEDQLELHQVASLLLNFLALPVIGLYYSMVCRGYLSALILTLVVGVIVPEVATAGTRLAINVWLYPEMSRFWPWWAYLTTQGEYQVTVGFTKGALIACLAGSLGWRLRGILARRTFVAERSGV